MPDPNGLYSKFLEKHPDFAKCLVNPPLILDQNQDVIKPQNYGERLVHLAPVSLEVYACVSVSIVPFAIPQVFKQSFQVGDKSEQEQSKRV